MSAAWALGSRCVTILVPLSHCAAVVGCRNQPLAGMKDATTPLWMGGQLIAFSLCLI